MAGIGIGPHSLANPVAGADEANALDSFMAQAMPAPTQDMSQASNAALTQPQAQPEAMPQAMPSSELQDFLQAAQAMPSADAGGSLEAFLQEASAPKKLSELADSTIYSNAKPLSFTQAVHLSMARTPEQVQELLNRDPAKLGFPPGTEVVTTKDKSLDKVKLVTPAGQVFRAPEFGEMELSAVGNYARMALEAAVGIGAEAVQAPGAIALAPFTAGLSVANSVGLSAAAGTAAGRVAEPLFGYKPSPDDNAGEALGSLADSYLLGSTFGLFAGGKAAKAPLEATEKITQQAERELSRKTSLQLAQEAAQPLRDLEASGKILPSMDSMRMLPDELLAKDAAHAVPMSKLRDMISSQDDATRSKLANFINARGQQLKTVGQAIVNDYGLGGDDATKAFTDVKSYVSALRKTEGENIGAVRDEVAKQLGDTKYPTFRNLKKVTDEFSAKLGMPDVDSLRRMKQNPYKTGAGFDDVFPSFDNLRDKALVNSKPEYEMLKSNFQRLYQAAYNSEGGATGKEVTNMYRGLSKIVDNFYASKAVTEGTPEWVRLMQAGEKAARTDFDDVVRSALHEGKLSQATVDRYGESMSRYGKVKDAAELFANTLKQDDVSTHALASELFSNAKVARDKVTGLKALLQMEEPELWDKLVAADFKQQFVRNTTNDVTNWSALAKRYENMDPKVVEEMFGSKPLIKDLKSMAKLTERFDGLSNNLNDTGKIATLRALASKLVGLMPKLAAVDAATSLFTSGARKEALEKMLSKDGIENFIAKMPSEQRPLWRQIITNVNSAESRSTLGTVPPAIKQQRERRQ